MNGQVGVELLSFKRFDLLFLLWLAATILRLHDARATLLGRLQTDRVVLRGSGLNLSVVVSRGQGKIAVILGAA